MQTVVRLSTGLAALSLALTVTPSRLLGQSDKPNPGPLHTIEFDTDEGTAISVDVSPDGKTLLFDLLGDIYTLPIQGGEATLLIGGRDWDHRPRYSPDGKSIAFVSDRDGTMNVWIADANGTNLKQVGFGGPVVAALWAPDGMIVEAASDRATLHYRQGGSLPLPAVGGAMSFSPDGRFVYSSGWGGFSRYDRQSGETKAMGDGFMPKVSPDGRLVVYGVKWDHRTSLMIRDLETGAARVLADSTTPGWLGWSGGSLADYAFTPDGKSVVLSIDGKLARIDVATGVASNVPFKAHVSQQVVEPIQTNRRVDDGDLVVRVPRWLSTTADGKKAVFSALGKIYLMDLPNGAARRLTSSDEREYMPSISPDGQSVVYSTWTDTAYGHIKVVKITGGTPRQMTAVAGRYSSPVWSRDGSKIAYAMGGNVEKRGQQPESEQFFDLFWQSADGGTAHPIVTIPPRAGFSMRYYPVVAFNPDGTRIFYNENGQQTTLISVRLDGTDKKSHLTFANLDEVVPSPDGQHVAYVRREQVMYTVFPGLLANTLNVSLDHPSIPHKKLTKTGGNYVHWQDNGTLTWIMTNKIYQQRIDEDTARQIGQVNLTVPRAKPEGVVAYTDARIVTMRGTEVIERGTIVVDKNRITAVGPSESVAIPAGAKVVKLTGKTIVPGLIDVHAHMHYQAYELFPERKWEYIVNLAYGVTTAFDPSAHNLDVFAQQELVEAGEMLGPRIYSTGDVIYGDERGFPVVYESITGLDAARNVVRRFKTYNVEMLKQYMQPRRDQRQWVIQAAREEGVRVTAEGGGDLVLDLTMVLDGYTAFEHNLPTVPLYRDVTELVGRSKIHYTPTLIVAYGGNPPSSLQLYFESVVPVHDDAKLRRFTPERELDGTRHWRYVPPEELHFLGVSQGAAKITKAGGLVTLGAHGNRQGAGAQWELWGLQMGGMSNWEALRSATLYGAQKIGYGDDLGSIEVGKLADFLVLDANPLDDIRNTQALRYVVKNGFVWDAPSMTQLHPVDKKLGRFFWQTDRDRRLYPLPEPVRWQ